MDTTPLYVYIGLNLERNVIIPSRDRQTPWDSSLIIMLPNTVNISTLINYDNTLIRQLLIYVSYFMNCLK